MPKREGWVNVYKGRTDCVAKGQGIGLANTVHSSEEAAKREAYCGWIATVKIEWFEPGPKKETYSVRNSDGSGTRYWAVQIPSLEEAKRHLETANLSGVAPPYTLVKVTEEELA